MYKVPRYTQQISVTSFFRAFFTKELEFPSDFMFFNSGRGAIKWLLSQKKQLLKKKLRVGVPCYTCYTVFQAVQESDNDVILMDIDPLCFLFTGNLYNQLKDLDVIIWINYFGFRYQAVLKEIRTRFPELIILEDCSQVDLRDYLRKPADESCSDYVIFSFNFRKPITAGGGGLLIPGIMRKAEVAMDLFPDYSRLPYEKLNFKRIIHILIYNFSYNCLIFLLFNKLINKRRNLPFKPDEIPIKCLLMNRLLRKIFYIQFKEVRDKVRSEKFTFNYFANSSELVNNNSFGSLSYYTVILNGDNKLIGNKIDKFILWGNLAESYKYFEISVSKDEFPLTFNFLSEAVFLPAKYFAEPNKGKIVFPACLT